MQRPVLIAVALLAAVFAACGTDDTPAAPPAATVTQPATFPATVVADQGKVVVPSRPGRIVSLSPSLTELLYAIDAGDQVIAVDKNSDYPTGTPMTDLSGFRPNVEAVAGYEPDLVVMASDRDGAVSAIANLGVPTLLLGSPDRVDAIYDQIETLGAATGHVQEAERLADRLRTDLKRIAASAPVRKTPLRYFYELSETHHSVTSRTFIGQVLGLAGLQSIADATGEAAGDYPQLSTEAILDSDPDVIFLAYTSGATPAPESLSARPGWDQLSAVRGGHVIVLDDDIASRWGPRVVELLETVVDATDSLTPT